VKDQVAAKEWIHWMNSKHGSLQQLQMLQRTWYSASRKRWTIVKMNAELQMALTVKYFTPNAFSTYVQKNCFNWIKCLKQLCYICFHS
jgi:hypothetical protein